MLDWHRIGTAVENRSVTEEGQVLIEYALILALIAVAVVVVVGLLGGKINGIFSNITSNL
jgi:pilus assembly protein Flp/PilA